MARQSPKHQRYVVNQTDEVLSSHPYIQVGKTHRSKFFKVVNLMRKKTWPVMA